MTEQARQQRTHGSAEPLAAARGGRATRRMLAYATALIAWSSGCAPPNEEGAEPLLSSQSQALTGTMMFGTTCLTAPSPQTTPPIVPTVTVTREHCARAEEARRWRRDGDHVGARRRRCGARARRRPLRHLRSLPHTCKALCGSAHAGGCGPIGRAQVRDQVRNHAVVRDAVVLEAPDTRLACDGPGAGHRREGTGRLHMALHAVHVRSERHAAGTHEALRSHHLNASTSLRHRAT
jgi:hypothetical protein